MFNMCLSEDKLPNSWENASVSIHQKGDTADIKETTDRCCSSIVSDDDYNFSSMMMMSCLVGLWVRRWLISPSRACSTLTHSGHGYVGPDEVLVIE